MQPTEQLKNNRQNRYKQLKTWCSDRIFAIFQEIAYSFSPCVFGFSLRAQHFLSCFPVLCRCLILPQCSILPSYIALMQLLSSRHSICYLYAPISSRAALIVFPCCCLTACMRLSYFSPTGVTGLDRSLVRRQEDNILLFHTPLEKKRGW